MWVNINGCVVGSRSPTFCFIKPKKFNNSPQILLIRFISYIKIYGVSKSLDISSPKITMLTRINRHKISESNDGFGYLLLRLQ